MLRDAVISFYKWIYQLHSSLAFCYSANNLHKQPRIHFFYRNVFTVWKVYSLQRKEITKWHTEKSSHRQTFDIISAIYWWHVKSTNHRSDCRYIIKTLTRIVHSITLPRMTCHPWGIHVYKIMDMRRTTQQAYNPQATVYSSCTLVSPVQMDISCRPMYTVQARTKLEIYHL